MALTKVSTDGVKDDAITSGKIPANAVGASELATDSVGYSELAVNAVGNENISAGSISSGKMASDSVATAAIQDQAVTAAKLASGVQTTINNNADNRVITGSGTANTLEGESNLTFDGSNLAISGELDVHKSGTGDVFHVQGNGTGAVVAKVENAYNSDNDRFAILELKSGKGSIRFNSNGDSNEGAITYNMADNTMVFGVNNASEKLRIQSGGGISFNGDTATANALDDYEEGTFVVGFKFSNQNFNGSLSTAQGYYTKIGRQVFVSLQLVVSDKGTNTSGGAMITGLPFAVLNADNARASGVVGYHQGTSGIDFPIQILVEQNQTQFPLRQAQATSANIDSSNLSNGFRVYITVAYFAA